MGLDVSVYKNVKLCEDQSDDAEDYDFLAFVLNPEGWGYKIKNLKADKLYKGDWDLNAKVGYSYGSHSRFREHLCLMQGLKIDAWQTGVGISKETPFYELLDFADNEGCLDWEISKILYKNFKDWRDEAARYFRKQEQAHFANRYNDWLEVFKSGKDINSVVNFS